MKKKMGRPRRKEGTISFWNFQRAGIAMSLYDDSRMDGQKHSAAVAQTVELIKQRHPQRQISETEVKRILALWRPRENHTIIRFECSTLTEEELAKLSMPSDLIHPNSVTTYRMNICERPNYPRHNRKLPKV